jgi:hypothetical protein
MRCILPLLAVTAMCGSAFAQHLIVTAEGHHGTPPAELMKDDVSVEIDNRPARIDQWTPLRGGEAALQLFILIDDGADTDLGVQYSTLKQFMNTQPSSTEIGLAYMRNGSAQIAVNMTADHAAVGAGLRIPLGQPGISSSPYMAVSDLVKKWPATAARREILMITSGVDPWSPVDPRNPYLLSAIEACQRAGILANSIYYAGAGHFGHSFWRTNWGQNYLSELGDETGGEAYWQGTASPVSFDPYLKDFAERLNNQYLVTVTADGAKKGLQPVKVTTTKAGVSLMSASRIFIPK